MKKGNIEVIANNVTLESTPVTEVKKKKKNKSEEEEPKKKKKKHKEEGNNSDDSGMGSPEPEEKCPFQKCFYTMNATTEAMAKSEVKKYYKEHNITMKGRGRKTFKPLLTFAELGFPSNLSSPLLS